MENKYYTPSIDEFYLGFEYYFKNSNEQPPSYYSYEEFGRYETLDELEDQILNDNIKVKYLDQNDIESLGWGFEENLQYCDQFKYKSLEAYLWVIKDENLIEIQCEKTYFRGCIQNKSELKKLMKQIGIK